jgi:hypothetical protein
VEHRPGVGHAGRAVEIDADADEVRGGGVSGCIGSGDFETVILENIRARAQPWIAVLCFSNFPRTACRADPLLQLRIM